ncbi:NAD(P)/FAD-dependent oxidoreductase [Halocola ammonii]
MPQTIQLALFPAEAENPTVVKQKSASHLGIAKERIAHVELLKKSIDARQKKVKFNLKLEVYIDGETYEPEKFELPSKDVSKEKAVHIVGAGPAGLFAALELIEKGIKPILIERGKDVKSRRRDLAKLNREHLVNPESNYCFGEGGAGTYSDGKLYTRSKKRGDIERVLKILVAHGADRNILVDAHPHIGTNRLPAIIESMRSTILNCGGQVRFETKLTDLIVKNGKIAAIELNGEKWETVDALVLATGHSARDIFELLNKRGVAMEAKPFALGVRVEHPQKFVDACQYHTEERGELLPPASYSLVAQLEGYGVYSFCMCPGGIIAPCATSPGEVVTNGWSPSKRNNPFANSGIVVPVGPEDWKAYEHLGSLAGVAFQREVEQKCWEAGGETQRVPAQRLKDFVEGKLSASLPECSYLPGIVSARVDEILPERIVRDLQRAFREYDKKMKGFIHPDAIVVAPESRTSSPVRILRDRETFQNPSAAGLYPSGEGAGFAGGIVSAAMDGQKTADKCAEALVR